MSCHDDWRLIQSVYSQDIYMYMYIHVYNQSWLHNYIKLCLETLFLASTLLEYRTLKIKYLISVYFGRQKISEFGGFTWKRHIFHHQPNFKWILSGACTACALKRNFPPHQSRVSVNYFHLEINRYGITYNLKVQSPLQQWRRFTSITSTI